MPPAAGPQLCSRLEALGAGTILVNRTPLLIPSARPKQRLVSAEQCGFSSALQNYRVAKRRALSFCCCAATNTTQADAVAQVLQAVKDTERGVSTSPEQKQRILQAVGVLAKSCKAESTTEGPINASWKLVWTTEKETLFILKNAKLFGTKAGDVFQVIDLGQSSLQNVITFENGASFVIDSSLEISSEKRLTFKFSGARLNLPSRTWKLPPFGKGWFDTIYLDDTIRVAKDIRGDTLIVQRDGAPRQF